MTTPTLDASRAAKGDQHQAVAPLAFKGGPHSGPPLLNGPGLPSAGRAFLFPWNRGNDAVMNYARRPVQSRGSGVSDPGSQLLVTEIFHSLQGETSLSGLRFAFIRLTGCNLRCSYCDSAYAFKGGRAMSIAEILGEVSTYGVKHVLLTGGEPLLQRGSHALMRSLVAAGYTVSIETHGETRPEALARFSPHARIIMDVKTPGSGMCRGGFEKNLPHLKADDEVKFVITSRADYTWARDLVRSGRIPTREILFSPAVVAAGSPGSFEGVEPRWLAESIVADRLPVRLQFQIHKLLWGPDRKGV